MISVQRIESCWTKKSRGMPGAHLRNTVPERLALMEQPSPKGLSIHEVKAYEKQGFALYQKSYSQQKTYKYYGLYFDMRGDQLHVFFSWEQPHHGHPVRTLFKKKVFVLEQGETAALLINGRFVSCSGQWYKKHSINIACGPHDRDVFLNGEFDAKLDLQAALF